MNIHPNITPASPSLASPIFDASFDSIESLTTSFAASVVPTLETTTVTEVALGYHRNQQYSITAMTTSSGAVAERYAYTAYGQPTILNASGTVLTSSAVGNRYTYTGREWDETLGLHHFRARWISPLAGRFLRRDPIGYEGSEWGGHEYLEARCLVSLDPSGLIPQIPQGNPMSPTEQHCVDFYNNEISKNATWKKCWDQFIALTGHLPDDRKAFCRKVGVTCMDKCPKGAIATLPDPERPEGTNITLCTSQPCFMKKPGIFDPLPDPGPFLCHELIHVLQFRPGCSARPYNRRVCVEVLAAELQAYYCSNMCRNWSGCNDLARAKIPADCDFTQEELDSVREVFEQTIRDGEICQDVPSIR